MLFVVVGVVSTVAGSGVAGYGDGVGTVSVFYNPSGVSVDSSGSVIVADTYNNRIRKISTSGISLGWYCSCFVYTIIVIVVVNLLFVSYCVVLCVCDCNNIGEQNNLFYFLILFIHYIVLYLIILFIVAICSYS